MVVGGGKKPYHPPVSQIESLPIFVGDPTSREGPATRYRILARGEAGCENGGCGYEIAERFFIRVLNHEAFRASFGPGSRYDCVMHARTIDRLYRG